MGLLDSLKEDVEKELNARVTPLVEELKKLEDEIRKLNKNLEALNKKLDKLER